MSDSPNSVFDIAWGGITALGNTLYNDIASGGESIANEMTSGAVAVKNASVSVYDTVSSIVTAPVRAIETVYSDSKMVIFIVLAVAGFILYTIAKNSKINISR